MLKVFLLLVDLYPILFFCYFCMYLSKPASLLFPWLNHCCITLQFSLKIWLLNWLNKTQRVWCTCTHNCYIQNKLDMQNCLDLFFFSLKSGSVRIQVADTTHLHSLFLMYASPHVITVIPLQGVGIYLMFCKGTWHVCGVIVWLIFFFLSGQ